MIYFRDDASQGDEIFIESIRERVQLVGGFTSVKEAFPFEKQV